MARAFDGIVLGSDVDGLVAAIVLAQKGLKVLVLEEQAELGGASREIEFAPGFRAAPLAPDAGYLAPDLVRALGLQLRALPVADPAVISLADGEPLLLRSSVAHTAQELAGFSAKDAREWPRFAERMSSMGRFLAELYAAAPPRVEARNLDDWLSLAGLGRRLRRLAGDGMVDLLRTVPMSLADLLEDTFESARLRGTLAALGVMDVCQGPLSGGTAFTFLHRHVGAEPGVFSERLRLESGTAGLMGALVDRARALGVVLEVGQPIGELRIRDGRVTGVTLASGEDIPARVVLSSLDPCRSLLELIDPVHLEPEFIQAARNIRYRGVTTKILLALDDLPTVPGAHGPLAGCALIARDIRYVERAYDAAKYGRCSEECVVELRFPSVTWPQLAPRGRHVAVLHVQFTPWRLREGSWSDVVHSLSDRVLSLVEREIPGFTARIRERVVLTPDVLQARFGLREGALSQGELMLDQMLFMRPVPGFSHHAMPLCGYYLCGAGTHPGPGITGRSGALAARTALRSLAHAVA